VAGATALLSVVLLDVTKGEHAIRIVIDRATKRPSTTA
jgi:hypothetical protein